MANLYIYEDSNIDNDLVWCKKDLPELTPNGEQSAPNNITDSNWININFCFDNYTSD